MRIEPRADDAAPSRAYICHVNAPESATQSLASLAHARARQIAVGRRLRLLGFGVIGVVVATSVSVHPRPGLSGRGLGILIALIVLAGCYVLLGVRGQMMRGWAVSTDRRLTRGEVITLVTALAGIVASSAVLLWLQPKGAGFIGAFVGVSIGALWARRWGWALLAGAVIALVIAGVASSDRNAAGVVGSALGVTAFYLVASLARRLRDGQQQAERLLVELDRTRAAESHAAALGERQRLAREMHDVLAHSLSGLVLQLEGARLLAEHDAANPRLTEAVARAHQLARTGLEEARRAIGMLRDVELPGPERFAALAQEFERDSGVHVDVEVTGPERELGSDARLTLYRVAQEALTNVRKHADAERVRLRLGYEDGGTRLTIEDFARNGRRSDRDSAAENGGGYGLTGMRERAELLGGSLSAAATDAGFRVELWVPA